MFEASGLRSLASAPVSNGCQSPRCLTRSIPNGPDGISTLPSAAVSHTKGGRGNRPKTSASRTFPSVTPDVSPPLQHVVSNSSSRTMVYPLPLAGGSRDRVPFACSDARRGRCRSFGYAVDGGRTGGGQSQGNRSMEPRANQPGVATGRSTADGHAESCHGALVRSQRDAGERTHQH